MICGDRQNGQRSFIRHAVASSGLATEAEDAGVAGGWSGAAADIRHAGRHFGGVLAAAMTLPPDLIRGVIHSFMISGDMKDDDKTLGSDYLSDVNNASDGICR
jgi:hypothetical protein